MVLFNYSTKEITAKIVYYGPGLCGKTTNLQFIYDSLPQTINKGKMLSLATKTDRTLFFDFLPIDLGTIRGMRTRLQLYTVPGQVFYNTTRKLVLKGADGVVFVADSQRRMLDANLESLGNLEENLAEHDMKLSDIPMILQFNKRDLPDVATLDELNTAMNKYNAPIYEAVAPTGIGVHETLKAITRLVLNSLKERYADKHAQKPDAQTKAATVMAGGSSGPEKSMTASSPAPGPAAASTTARSTANVLSTAQETAPRMPAPVPPAMTGPAASGDDSEALSFDLPELEEPAEQDTASAFGGEALDPMEMMDSGIGLEPEPDPLSVEPSSGMMTGLSAGLDDSDDLLELAPETEPLIDDGGEDLLELADEPLSDLAHLEDSVAMPLLDVTSEMSIDDEPELAPSGETGSTAFTMATNMSPAGDRQPVNLDDSAQLVSMLMNDSPLESTLAVDEEMDGSTPVTAAEDHHDIFPPVPPSRQGTVMPVSDLGSVSAPVSIPPGLDRGRQSRAEGFDTLTDIASSMAREVRQTPGSAGMAREINLPVKLEIGGRCISFELKISLDLTEIAAHAGASSENDREARS